MGESWRAFSLEVLRKSKIKKKNLTKKTKIIKCDDS